MNHISLKKEKHMNNMYKMLWTHACMGEGTGDYELNIEAFLLTHTEVLPVVEFNLEEGIR